MTDQTAYWDLVNRVDVWLIIGALCALPAIVALLSVALHWHARTDRHFRLWGGFHWWR